MWHEEGSPEGYVYRVHDDGRVVVYAHEVEPPRPGLWRATAWDKDPRVHDDARYASLSADATWRELQVTLKRWEDA